MYPIFPHDITIYSGAALPQFSLDDGMNGLFGLIPNSPPSGGVTVIFHII